MRIDQVPVIATSHISRFTANVFEEKGDKNPWVTCASYEGGWLLWFGVDPYDILDWPADLRALYRWATDGGYCWVRLDCDADTVPELQTFDW